MVIIDIKVIFMVIVKVIVKVIIKTVVIVIIIVMVTVTVIVIVGMLWESRTCALLGVKQSALALKELQRVTVQYGEKNMKMWASAVKN